MTYLSKLVINPRNPRVWADIADCQRLHQTLSAGFGQAPAGDNFREHFQILYRLEQPRDGIQVLVQSAVEPDWAGLREPVSGEGPYALRSEHVCIDATLGSVRAGDRFRFRLRANPTRRATGRRVGRRGTVESEWEGKRIALTDESEQIPWLARQGERAGFRLEPVATNPDLPDVRVTPNAPARGKKGDGTKLSLGSVVFDGWLRVVDREALLEAVRAGVGRGKAYGYGLLSLAR